MNGDFFVRLCLLSLSSAKSMSEAVFIGEGNNVTGLNVHPITLWGLCSFSTALVAFWQLATSKVPFRNWFHGMAFDSIFLILFMDAFTDFLNVIPLVDRGMRYSTYAVVEKSQIFVSLMYGYWRHNKFPNKDQLIGALLCMLGVLFFAFLQDPHDIFPPLGFFGIFNLTCLFASKFFLEWTRDVERGTVRTATVANNRLAQDATMLLTSILGCPLAFATARYYGADMMSPVFEVDTSTTKGAITLASLAVCVLVSVLFMSYMMEANARDFPGIVHAVIAAVRLFPKVLIGLYFEARILNWSHWCCLGLVLAGAGFFEFYDSVHQTARGHNHDHDD